MTEREIIGSVLAIASFVVAFGLTYWFGRSNRITQDYIHPEPTRNEWVTTTPTTGRWYWVTDGYTCRPAQACTWAAGGWRLDIAWEDSMGKVVAWCEIESPPQITHAIVPRASASVSSFAASPPQK